MELPGFVGPSYISRSRMAACERTVNYYVEPIESTGLKGPMALYPSPGFDEFQTLPQTPCRGLIEALGRLFVVAGSKLYELGRMGTVTERGDVPQGLNVRPASMAYNGATGKLVMIASNRNGYYFDMEAGTLSQIAGLTVDVVDQIDGYFVTLDRTASEVRISPFLGRAAADNSFTWDATQFQRRSAAPDPWQAMIVWNDRIVLFGRETTETWENTGAVDFPFTHSTNLFIQNGIAAPDSVARVGESLLWLGATRQGSGQVYAMSGWQAERISTHAVEWAIEGYKSAGGIEDAIGWSISIAGHEFYVLEFPSADRTWVYDLTTGFWQEWGTWDGRKGDFGKWQPRYQAHAFGHNIVADSGSGRVAKLSLMSYKDIDGSNVVRERTAPHLTFENARLSYLYFELECQRGVGLSPAEDDPTAVNPVIELSYSDDGGNTWSIPRPLPLGKQGQYRQRIRWDRCGSARDRVFRVRTSAPVPIALTNAYIAARASRRRR